jgi:hypothetical protein
VGEWVWLRDWQVFLFGLNPASETGTVGAVGVHNFERLAMFVFINGQISFVACGVSERSHPPTHPPAKQRCDHACSVV